MYLNKAIVIGNLTRDPELKALPSGVKVCTFGVATNRVWRDRNGVRKEDAQFHNLVVFGDQAENVARYLRKGSSVLAEGRMQTRNWEGPDGTKRYRTEIVAERVQFGPRSAGGPPPEAAPSDTGEGQPPAKEGIKTIEYPTGDIDPEDIPF